MNPLTISAGGPTGAEEAFRQRLADLADDLRLTPAPFATWTPGPPGLAIDGWSAPIPLRLDRVPREEPAPDVARRLGEALFRARGRLLSAYATGQERGPSTAFAEAAYLGLDLDDTVQVGNRTPAGPDAETDRDWAFAEQRPASVTLLVAKGGLPDESTTAMTWQFVRELTGLPVPRPEVTIDDDLADGEVRLRLRAVRTPPVVCAPDDVVRLPRLIAAHAAMLLDAVMTLRLLVRATSGTARLLPETLRSAPAPVLARALRSLVAAGFPLPDAPALVAAVLARSAVAPGPGRRVVLPGTVAVGDADHRRDPLAARLRAAIVPGALLRRAGGFGRTASVWVLTEEAAATLPLDDPDACSQLLAQAALAPARAEGVLLVPDGTGARLRQSLADLLPTLCVAEVGEWPAGLEKRPRGYVNPKGARG